MNKGRLHTLDGMRGLAAIGVALFHVDNLGFHLVPSGYLAVDFFFALSGLVVSIAYEQRLGSAATEPSRFMLIRLARLYPLYLIGTMAGLAVFAAGLPIEAVRPDSTGAAFPFEIAAALAMLPDPWSPMALYPFNGPAWSLFYELAVNLFFAVVLIRLRTRWLAAVWLLALLVYAVKVDHAWLRGYGSNLGPYWQHVSAGVPRVIAGFTFGVLLARSGAWRHRRRSWAAALPVALLVGIMLAPPSRWLDLAAIAAVFPVCIAAASRVELPSWCNGACAFLGDLSYPLYAVHFPVIFATGAACEAVGIHGAGKIAVFLMASLTSAWLLANLDRAVQVPLKVSLKH